MEYVKQVVKLFCEQNIFSEDRATAVDIIEKYYSNAINIASTLIESGKKSTKKESILTTNSRCSPLMIFNYVQRTIPPISLLTLS